MPLAAVLWVSPVGLFVSPPNLTTIREATALIGEILLLRGCWNADNT